MKLEEWEALTEADRAKAMAAWDPYDPRGYWMQLCRDAADDLRNKLRDDSRVLDVLVGNYHGVLEIIVATPEGTPPLPMVETNYRGTYRSLPLRQIYK